MEEKGPPSVGQQCRLCLQCLDGPEGADRLRNIFAEDGDEALACRIRDCIGVFVSRNDAVLTICANCDQTICLIDEFRTLCRQTEEIYESVQVPGGDAQAEYDWEQYDESVGELRKLIRKRAGLVSEKLVTVEFDEAELFKPMAEVKEEPEDESMEEEDVWAAEESSTYLTEVLDIKVEHSDFEEKPYEKFKKETDFDANELLQGGITTPSDSKRKDYATQVRLATELKARLSKFTNHDKKNQLKLLQSVADRIGLSRGVSKMHWHSMKQYYRDGVRRAKGGGRLTNGRLQNCKLFGLLDKIIPILDGTEPYKAPAVKGHVESSQFLTYETKLKLVQQIETYPEIWNPATASSTSTVDRIWASLAEQLQIDRTTLRREWRRLQDMHRQYQMRVRAGRTGKPKDKYYQQILAIMDHIRQVRYGPETGAATTEMMKQEEPPEKKRCHEAEPEDEIEAAQQDEIDSESFDVPQKGTAYFKSNEDRLALATLIHKHYRVIWDGTSPNALRDKAWDEIAVKLKVDQKDLKYSWKCLRNLYRGRRIRFEKGLLLKRDRLYEKLDLLFNNDKHSGSHDGDAKSRIKAGKNTSSLNDSTEQGDIQEEPDFEFDSDARLKLAKLCLPHEFIWNNQNCNIESAVRDTVWDSIGEQMGFTRTETKEAWIRLRSLYRCRKVRLMNGEMDSKDPAVTDKLYSVLDQMLGETMKLGSRGGCGAKKYDEALNRFSSVESKLELVQEVKKQEFIWNVYHENYHKSELRGAYWNQLAEHFGCDANQVKCEWRRQREGHRVRRHQAIFGKLKREKLDQDPLHQLMQEMFPEPEVPTGKPTSDQKRKFKERARNLDATDKLIMPTRRYTGKRTFNDEGCIKVDRGGVTRYEKICELCGAQIERSLFEYHMNLHYGLQPYECSFEGCDRKYGNKITRDRHEVMVHGEDGCKFECDQCGEKFKQRGQFDYHYAVNHVSQEVPCEICGKKLKHKSMMADHIRRHKDNFPCNVCGKVLQRRWSLTVHMRTHTNEKPYPCEMCDQRFILKVQLKTHMAKMHNMTLE